MEIAVIGAGNVGAALAGRFVTAGHTVRLAASDPASERLAAAAAATGATAVATPLDAVRGADLAVLAVPFAAVDDVLTPDVREALAGTVVVDPTNPLTADYLWLTVGHTTSAAEHVAALLPASRVVKAFNTVMAATLATPELGGARQPVPVAGDDDAAKAVVLDLARELGFDARDLGPLAVARHLEPAVEVLIHLAYARGLGPGIGLALVGA